MTNLTYCKQKLSGCGSL